MTAKDKAKELVDRFSNVKRPMLKGHNLSVNMHPEHVKQCALICVDEFIDALSFNSSPTAEGLTEFYEKVKQEINKL
tara:strand:- start:1016 stop:1246 length:231 start_codon:yes stop_codon:yes gene_type:complete